MNENDDLIDKITTIISKGIDAEFDLQKNRSSAVSQSTIDYFGREYKELNDVFEKLKSISLELYQKLNALHTIQRQIVNTLTNFDEERFLFYLGQHRTLLHNVIEEIKSVERRAISALGTEQESSSALIYAKETFKDYNKSHFTIDQVLFIGNELRNNKFTLTDLNDTKLALGLNLLTGYSPNTLRPGLGKFFGKTKKLSDGDKEKLKDLLKRLLKSVEEN